MCPASASDKYYVIRLIKCSLKKKKKEKIKNTRGVPPGPRLAYYVTNAHRFILDIFRF